MKEKTKVLCIKDTIGFNKGETYETVWNFIKSNIDTHVFWSRFPEYFQEVVDKSLETKPRWKVGDKVVIDSKWWDKQYFIINNIKEYCNGWYSANDYPVEILRIPTQEELSLYFRTK